jgi:hypothetical protein
MVEQVSMYSIMEYPMTSCGCFECIMMIIPEANGFMTVSREDPSMTPAGMTFSTLAGTAGGGLQTPGVMGHGKFFITSKKFIKADGGLKRIVWMSSFLKESMAEELKEAGGRHSRRRPRSHRQDRRREGGHHGRGTVGLHRGEGTSSPDHASSVLKAK